MSKNDNLQVALVQTDIFWEDKVRNLKMYDHKLDTIKNKPDLIILPETFNTGFCMKQAAVHAETMDGNTIQWMKRQAKRTGAVMAGSCMIKENNNYYNRLLWVRPDGSIDHYDKAHLFRLAYEQNYFSSGDKRVIVTLKGWRICLNVCYDLRFPIWCRNKNDYDLLLFVANWPEVRVLHWSALLKARAIENLSYVIGVNRVGIDGTDKAHSGHSAVINPNGAVITSSTKEEVLFSEISKQDLDTHRKRFQFYKDADNFQLKP